MAFASFSKEYNQAGYTLTDNLFITEYLEFCNAAQVKVYMFGLYLIQSGNETANSVEKMSAALKIDEAQIIKAYEFFEDQGIVDIISKSPLEVKYIPLSGAYGRPRKIKASKYSEFTKQVQALLPDRMISPNEYNEYFHLIEDYGIEPEALIMIINYCTKLQGTKINFRYIVTVAKDWAFRGIKTFKAAEKELSTFSGQEKEIKDMLKALGLKHIDYDVSPMYTKWRNQLGFSFESVICAAKIQRQTKGTVPRLDSFLEELYKNKKYSVKEIEDYGLEFKEYRNLANALLKELGDFVSAIEPVIESYVVPWTDGGFDRITLLAIANYCFKAGTRKIEGMNKFVLKLKKMGYVTLEGVNEYIDNAVYRERTIQKMLTGLGLDRLVTAYDRDNYALFSESWGISDEIILLAAEKVKGFFNPAKNLHALLSYVKNNRIADAESLKRIDAAKTVGYIGAFNKDTSERRIEGDKRAEAEARVNEYLNEVLKNKEISDVYYKIRSLELDIAKVLAKGGNAETLIAEQNACKKMLKELYVQNGVDERRLSFDLRDYSKEELSAVTDD